MKLVGKKAIIYSMLGLMQVGMFSSVAAAAPGPLHNDGSQRIAYLDRDDRHDNDRRRDHDERMRKENERHEREMKRRSHESEREWRERQERENERHDRELREIAALLIGIAIGSGSNN
ncbi:hypothetical protein [Sporomusa acidovorans]|uniref:Uncharacterized protein n=1 Tax=Sporomusa acidovorans (strain ATCC 49682 / DSM 3132 / Mol) TaxID=1123286 RepID=A0ABZ3JAP6_SPOA4|nr:hypothetical protein [Sporomusa acidovorans]OZC18585.1 hypothetical protein SPACI_33060 [Sporomusa acidovorans DSM 3132]SDF52522.1 hypothetical protein SAMN04488499_105527 [Sporomusa acidovorans]